MLLAGPAQLQYATLAFGSALALFLFYAGIVALAANLVVAAVATLALRAGKAPEGVDRTQPDEFFADAGDPAFGTSRRSCTDRPVTSVS